MKVAAGILATVAGLLLVAPVVLLVGIALGPAILVMLFIGGFAVVICGLLWAVERVVARHT
jgi:hypothetical protein